MEKQKNDFKKVFNSSTDANTAAVGILAVVGFAVLVLVTIIGTAAWIAIWQSWAMVEIWNNHLLTWITFIPEMTRPTAFALSMFVALLRWRVSNTSTENGKTDKWYIAKVIFMPPVVAILMVWMVNTIVHML